MSSCSIRKLQISFVIFVATLSTAHPISETTAKVGAIAGGAAVGAGAGAVTYFVAFDNHSNQSQL